MVGVKAFLNLTNILYHAVDFFATFKLIFSQLFYLFLFKVKL
nr:MAG TPA: hypothetical protein [Caudoviricetes sp.]